MKDSTQTEDLRQQAGRIGFTGPFSDVNYGDYAMVVNNIYDIDRSEVTLFSSDDEFLIKIRDHYLAELDVRIVGINLDEDGLRTADENYPFTAIEMRALATNLEELRNQVAQLSLLVVNGGGYFNGLWSLRHRISKLVSIMLPALVAREMNVPVIFTGNSYGPFGPSAAMHSSFFAYLQGTTFGCRDDMFSPMWMREIGVSEGSLRVIPDDLLVLNKRLAAMKPTVKITTEPYVVLETYVPVADLEASADKLRCAADQMYDEFGLHTVTLPFNLAHGGIEQAEYLSNLLDHNEFIDIRARGFLPIEDAASIIGGARMVISNRYHAQVHAVGLGTPSVGVLRPVIGDRRYYYTKNLGMLRQALAGVPFREEDYLRFDFSNAVAHAGENFAALCAAQQRNFGGRYRDNLKAAVATRKNFLSEALTLAARSDENQGR